MGYRLGGNESLSAGVRRIGREQVGEACAAVEAPADRHAAVHAARKRCKKVRALLRLVRDGFGDAYRDENRALRDAARELSHLRDARVVLATHADVVRPVAGALDARRLATIRERLAGDALPGDAGAEHRALDEALGACASALRAAATRIDGWGVDGAPGAILRKGVKRTYKRARDAWRTAGAERVPDAYHAWRKRAKYHWYHMRLLANAKSANVSSSRIEALHQLSSRLGDAHDLAVYEGRLLGVADDSVCEGIEVLRSLSARRRAELERRALALGESLFDLKPKRFASRTVAD